MKLEELKNKKIAILGFGLEGKSTLKFLEKINVKNISIFDKSFPDIDGYQIFSGENYLDNIDKFDIIFKSPGISPYNNPELLKVKEKLTSQAEIFADNFEGKIIGITGTKGKSTTSTLLYEILKELGYNVKLVGNIGNPVLDEIDIIQKNSPFLKGSTGNVMKGEGLDFVVYELSSYMLEGLDLNIYIGLLNNIYDCHLDWHDGRKNYENAKFNIFKNAKYKLISSELKDNVGVPLVGTPGKSQIDFFGLEGKYNFKNNFFNIGENKILEDENIALNGEHNRKNIAGIIGILDKIGIFGKQNELTNNNSSIIPFYKGDEGINIEKIKKVLSEFTGLAHRQENIGTYKGITFINDAIASTPESAIAAIKTFGEKIGTVFIGNEDSGFDLTKLKETILEYKIKNIVLFPETGEKLFGDFSKNMEYNKPHFNPLLKGEGIKGFIIKTLSMEEAVKFAYKYSNAGEVVLLSTGAPSFNASGSGKLPWKSYIEKGNLFKKYVEKYGKE